MSSYIYIERFSWNFRAWFTIRVTLLKIRKNTETQRHGEKHGDKEKIQEKHGEKGRSRLPEERKTRDTEKSTEIIVVNLRSILCNLTMLN